MSRGWRVARSRKCQVMLAAGLVVAGTAISGCSPDQAGSAAVVGDVRITDEQLTQEAQLVTSALHIDQSDRVNQVILDRLIRKVIFDEMAAEQNITITQGQLDQFLSNTAKQLGGESQLEDQLMQSGVPGPAIQSFAMTYLQQQALAEKLAPGKSAQDQGQALGDAAMQISQALNTQVSPRFGTWDTSSLSVGPIPDDLSAPLPSSPSDAMLNSPSVEPDQSDQAPVQGQ